MPLNSNSNSNSYSNVVQKSGLNLVWSTLDIEVTLGTLELVSLVQ